VSEEKLLMSGNHALAEAAIRAGCKFYFGYPITPQNEVPEYMSREMPGRGGTFVQAESELAAINMVLGASVAGARAMTSSSSPGIALKQEGISFLAGQELPAVIVNIVRGGPGLGNIAPAQSDYFQATRGGGHGDYRTIVLSPSSVQELVNQMYLAFDLADIYRNPVLVLGEGLVGQMREPIVFPEREKIDLPHKDYILNGAKGRPSRFSRSLILNTQEMEAHNWKLHRKYQLIEHKEVRYETFMVEDAEMVVVAFGLGARIAKGAIKRLRREGLKVGLFRPITLWPYPTKELAKLGDSVKEFFVFELNTGQMVDDVKIALMGKAEVFHHGRPGGVVPTPLELGRVITRRYYQTIGKSN
jgi:2-oxoglutarate/2-oxoacid ferredoxin oxidoreductase subunit alpha